MAKPKFMPGDVFISKLLSGYRNFQGIELEENFNLAGHPLYCKLQQYLKDSEHNGSLRRNPVNLSDSIIMGLIAPRFHLPNLVAKNIRISNSDLRYADLRFTRFNYAKIFNTNLEQANLAASEIDYAHFVEDILHKASMRWVKSSVGAQLDQIEAHFVDFYNANMKKSRIRHSKFIGSKWNRANLAEMVMNFVNMDRSNIKNAKNIETCQYLSTSSFRDVEANNEELAALEIARLRDNYRPTTIINNGNDSMIFYPMRIKEPKKVLIRK